MCGARPRTSLPPSGPGPVTYDKAHPYIDDGAARRYSVVVTGIDAIDGGAARE